MKIRRELHAASLMKMIMLGMCMVLLIQIGNNIIFARRLQKETRSRLENMLNYLAEGTAERLDGLYGKLQELVMVNEELNIINDMSHEMDVLNARRRISKELKEIQHMYGNEYAVFIYDGKMDQYYYGNRAEWNITAHDRLIRALTEHIRASQEELEPRGVNWSLFEFEGVRYVYAYETHLDYYAGAVVSEEDFLSMGGSIGDQAETVLYLVSLNDGQAGVEETAEEKLSGLRKEIEEKGYMVMVQDVRKADFALLIATKSSEALYDMMPWQIAVWVAVAVMCFLTISVFLLIKNKVIGPLEYFADNLLRYSENGEDSYFEDSHIYELEQANELFKRNLESMKELKIRVYEETLKKQRLEMEYTKLQINPHFYINCMNQIYNMACMEDYENIQIMASNISDYFRYIFRKKSDYVELSEELEHIRTYLNMSQFRYGKNFSYDVDITADVSDVKIPPLLLHTFVENALKYGMGREYDNHVGVRVERFMAEGQELVTIEVNDNGSGFPEEILDRLQRQDLQVNENGSMVGIANAVYRLDFLYHGQARLKFFNREGSGAVIRLCIPVKCPEPEVTTDEEGRNRRDDCG